MDIKIKSDELSNELGSLDFSVSPSFVVEPVFEYQAIEFEEYKKTVSEYQIPNCYLETKFDTTIEHPELEGLVFFKTSVISRSSEEEKFRFDRRRYFVNFSFYQTNENIINNFDRADRFENILLTNYSTNGSVSRNKFYNEGRSIGKVFPNKINLKLFGLGANPAVGNFKTFLNQNNYKYSFLHDIVQETSMFEIREVFLNDIETEVNFYDLWNDYTGPIEIDQGDHTALIKNNEPDVDQAECYSDIFDKLYDVDKEIVFVRIQKTSANGTTQNFWIYPNSDGEVQYCDTQVKIEKEYTYQAFVYVLIVEELSDGGQNIDPSDEQQPRLYEIPIGEPVVAKIMQPPHPRPQVEFKNIKHKKNKIKILMNLSSNEYKSLTYKGVNQAEEELFQESYNLYDPFGLRNSYFQYETETGKYQIFKMDRHPTSYHDIGISAEETIVTADRSTLAFFEDSIQPFKDYYYMIRSYNYYDYYSNPSPIYKVHMTKDANDTFLHVETVGFFISDQNKYMFEKTMAKLLQVVPSSYQTTLVQDEEFTGYGDTTNTNDLPDLGIVEEKIWDSNVKFKLRLVSKKTGKKIDLNLNFNLTKQITQNTE